VKAHILSRFFDKDPTPETFPRPFGILYSEDRFTYETAMQNQMDKALGLQGKGDLDDLISGKSTWTVE
jgi:2-oxoglutarate ferredoxin oxidoreductase subunit beta